MSSNAQDEDSVFLEHVLDQLYDFGSAQTKKKKKNKRKRSNEEEEETFSEKDVCRKVGGAVGGLKVEETGQSGGGEEEEEEEGGVEVVTFQDPHKKLRPKQTAAPRDDTLLTDTKQKDQEELDLEKARLDVHRFGITGYRKEQQREFEQDRAVMLGARPPKKNYVNYKLLQQQIKDRKQRAREEVQPELKKKKKKRNQQDHRKKASSGSGAAPTGQVGRFRDGMLILSSKEIQKIKGRRGAR